MAHWVLHFRGKRPGQVIKIDTDDITSETEEELKRTEGFLMVVPVGDSKRPVARASADGNGGTPREIGLRAFMLMRDRGLPMMEAYRIAKARDGPDTTVAQVAKSLSSRIMSPKEETTLAMLRLFRPDTPIEDVLTLLRDGPDGRSKSPGEGALPPLVPGQMKLLTKEIEKRMPVLYSQEDVKDPMCVAKFFAPDGQFIWYIIEGEWVDEDGQPVRQTEKDPVDYLMFTYVCVPDFPELGYVTLKQLMAVRGRLGLTVERDMYWKPRPLSTVKEECRKRYGRDGPPLTYYAVDVTLEREAEDATMIIEAENEREAKGMAVDWDYVDIIYPGLGMGPPPIVKIEKVRKPTEDEVKGVTISLRTEEIEDGPPGPGFRRYGRLRTDTERARHHGGAPLTRGMGVKRGDGDGIMNIEGYLEYLTRRDIKFQRPEAMTIIVSVDNSDDLSRVIIKRLNYIPDTKMFFKYDDSWTINMAAVRDALDQGYTKSAEIFLHLPTTDGPAHNGHGKGNLKQLEDEGYIIQHDPGLPPFVIGWWKEVGKVVYPIQKNIHIFTETEAKDFAKKAEQLGFKTKIQTYKTYSAEEGRDIVAAAVELIRTGGDEGVWFIHRPTNKKLLWISKVGIHAGEIQSTKELLAHEKNLKLKDIITEEGPKSAKSPSSMPDYEKALEKIREPTEPDWEKKLKEFKE